MPRSVSPGLRTAKYTDWFACDPECGCTFAYSAPKSRFTRSRASDSATSTNSQPTVIALARITLGVLVREHRALRLEHGLAHVVLRGDELEVVFLAGALAGDRPPQLRIDRGDAAAAPLGARAPGGDGNRAHAAFSTGNCVPGAGARAGAALHTVRSSIQAQA